MPGVLPPSINTLVADPDRLDVLHDLDLLDSPAEPVFDDIALTAAALCEAPIALVSLVDEHRQWFKARVGFEAKQTPVNQAVCAFALEADDLLIIPDLLYDPRTSSNPLVTGGDGIRFYAGAPLRTATGVALGSLCVIDKTPRLQGLTDAQRRGLEALARQVMATIALRRRIIEREASLVTQVEERRMLRQWMENVNAAHIAGGIGTFRYDRQTREFSISHEAQALFGLPPGDHYTPEVFERLVVEEDRHVASNARSRVDGSAMLDVVYRVRRANDQQIRWIARKATWERDEHGKIVAMIGSLQDVTQDTLVREELSHRFKNLMSMVLAISTQTLRSVKERDAVEAFEQRLLALAGANDMLARQHWSAAYINDAIDKVLDALGIGQRVHREGAAVLLGAQATIGLSLVVHELATNALKYGALSQEDGSASLAWRIEGLGNEAQLVLEWAERDGPPVTPPERRGFGSRLIAMGLLGAGGGTISYDETGVCACIMAPLHKVAPA